MKIINRIYQQNSFYWFAAAAVVIPAAVLIALRIFRQRAERSVSTVRYSPQVLSPPAERPTGNRERITFAANKAREETYRHIVNTNVQTEVLKYIALIERRTQELLGNNPSVVENAEQEFESVVARVGEIKQSAVDEIEKRFKLVSTGGFQWIFDIHGALLERSKEKFFNLLQQGAQNNFLNSQFFEFFGGTLFHLISKTERYLEYIPLFKDLPFDPAMQDLWGNTALIWAIADASNGSARAMLELFRRGPYLDVQCLGHANTALHLAVGKGYKTISRDGNRLMCSNLELVQLMVYFGTDPNLKNRDGNTPVHLAFLRRDPDMINTFARADKTMKNQNGQTPIDMLNLSYEQACKILDETVVAFTLDQREFEANGRSLRQKYHS